MSKLNYVLMNTVILILSGLFCVFVLFESNRIADVIGKDNLNRQALLKSLDWQKDKLNKIVNLERERINLVDTKSGQIVLDANTNPDFIDIEMCDGKRGLQDHWVEFDSEFILRPSVLVSIDGFDFDKSTDSRITVLTNEITKEGFFISIHTWCDTKLSFISVSWIAVGL